MKTRFGTALKREATKIVAKRRLDSTPLLITKGGKRAAYLVDATDFESLQMRVRILEGIARGEQAIQQGRVQTQTQAKRTMRRCLG